MIGLNLPLKTQKSAGVPVTPEVRRRIREGDAARADKAWDKAAERYRQALDGDPSLAHIWVQLGHALKETGELGGAENAYRRAIGLVPNSADAHLQLGHLLKLERRFPEAVEAYATALDLAPASPEALDEMLRLADQGVRIRSTLFRTLAGAALSAPFDRTAPTPSAATVQDLAARTEAAIQALSERLRKEGGGDGAAVIDALAWTGALVASLEHGPAPSTPVPTPLVFDASDLIHHFGHSRLPTGIQRVQLEVIGARLRQEPTPICCLFDHAWVEIPADLFLALSEASLADEDLQQAEWLSLLRWLNLVLTTSDPFSFPPGAWLVALGTSWHSEYLLQIRAAKETYGVRYVPYVHDLIPVKTPQFCLTEVTRDYVAWLLGVFLYADAFLTNSESTRRDLLEAADLLGCSLDPARVAVARLDADARKPGTTPPTGHPLRNWGLDRTPFVLFVSTIEPRKNHLAAFAAWERLVRRHGADRTPKLVCVGGRGWMNEPVIAMLDASETLKRQVVMLSGLSDAELGLLYRHSLFTLYPSHYEGWGLPITEALCYGKTPLIADNSSLPEAGAGLAEVFETGSEAGLQASLERLIFDEPYRLAKEQAIRDRFQPRTWADVAAGIDRSLALWSEPQEVGSAPANRSALAPAVMPGRYYPISRSRLSRLSPGAVHGGPLRMGVDWYRLEDWGCWSRSSSFSLAARIPPAPSGRLLIYLGVQGLPGRDSTFSCEVNDEPCIEGALPAWHTRWLVLNADWSEDNAGVLQITFRGDGVFDLAKGSEGADTRVVGPGVIGLYVCDAADLAVRYEMTEAISLGLLDRLAQPPASMSAPSARSSAASAQDRAPPIERDHEAATKVSPDLPRPNGTEGDVILLQTCDADRYYDMLIQSARTTRPYCQRHGFQYELFVGLKRGDLSWHATYNRIDLLCELIAQDFRGWVLYVDADAWIVDLDFDLRGFLADKAAYAMIAAPSGDQSDLFWNVNIGVMLFNLGHAFTRSLVEKWEAFLSRYDLKAEARHWNVEIPDDQGMFHQLLDKHEDDRDLILHVDKRLLNSPWASFVRQAIRAESTSFEERLALMTAEIEALSKDYASPRLTP